MLATSERVSPCRARCSPRSVGRLTSSSSPCCSTAMSRGMRSVSSPLGPLTRTSSGSIDTVTPDGTGMGFLPMRLMVLGVGGGTSPDVGHDLAADARVAGLVAGHHTPRGGHDRGPHAAEDLGDLGVPDVMALPGARDALEAGDGRATLVGVLERHADQLARVVGGGRLDLEVANVALLLEDAGHLALELAGRDLDLLVRGGDAVAHAGEEIGYRVGHRHRITRSSSSCPARSRCARARAGRCGRRRTCGTPSARGRSAGSGCTRGSCTCWGAPGARAARSSPSGALSVLGLLVFGLHEGVALAAEGHAERLEEGVGLGVGRGARRDRHVEAAHGVDRVVVDLGEDDLLAHAQRVVAAAVERRRPQAAEVADARDGDRHEAIEELVGALAAQRHRQPDGHALAHLELRDRLARAAHAGLLPGDGGQLLGRGVEDLGVLLGVADAHVRRDLLQARGLHRARVPEALDELLADLFVVSLFQTGHGSQSSLLCDRRVTRMRCPPSREIPTRVGFLSLGSMSMTLEMWIGPSFSITPPTVSARWAPGTCWGRWWRLTMFRPST